ncbi:MAG: deoxyribonuclease IV [Bacillota bacterium]
MRLGAHLSIAGGWASVGEEAGALGLESLQVFTRSPKGGRARPVSAQEVAAMWERLAAIGCSPVVVHVPYFINAASAEPDKQRAAVELLVEDLHRAEGLQARYLVSHIGSRSGRAEADAAAVALAVFATALRAYAGPVQLLLENTAGGGELGSRFEQVAAFLDALGDVGFCLDTCHAFAAGYDLRDGAAVARTLQALLACVGLERLRAVHLNDSHFPLGSGRDRHAPIGAGEIGEDGFRALLGRAELAHLPGILETPVGTPGDRARELGILRKLRGS